MIKYHYSFAWGCRELTTLERIKQTILKQPLSILINLIYAIVLPLIFLTVINLWLS